MAIRSNLTLDSVNGRLHYPLNEGQRKPEGISEADFPEDTELIDILEFFGKAYRRFPAMLLTDLIITGVAFAVGAFAALIFLDTFMLGVPVALMVWVLLLTRLPGRATRMVVVERFDDRGEPYLDGQRWWRDEFRKLPDAIQFTTEDGYKQPWLDTTKEKGETYAFNPWEGADPKTDRQAADIIAQRSLNQSGKALGMYRANRGLVQKYGWQLLLLGVSFILMFMAANRTQEYFGFTDSPNPPRDGNTSEQTSGTPAP